MNSLLTTSIAALAAVTLAMPATANAAPSGPPSIDATIDDLQSQGYEVVVHRVGDAEAGHCTLAGIRPGQTYSRTDSGAPGAGSDLVTTVMSKTVYVYLTC